MCREIQDRADLIQFLVFQKKKFHGNHSKKAKKKLYTLFRKREQRVTNVKTSSLHSQREVRLVRVRFSVGLSISGSGSS